MLKMFNIYTDASSTVKLDQNAYVQKVNAVILITCIIAIFLNIPLMTHQKKMRIPLLSDILQYKQFYVSQDQNMTSKLMLLQNYDSANLPTQSKPNYLKQTPNSFKSQHSGGQPDSFTYLTYLRFKVQYKFTFPFRP